MTGLVGWALGLMLATGASAQPLGVFQGGTDCDGTKTIAGLTSSFETGAVCTITNGSIAAGDCATTGTDLVTCRHDGADVWTPIGSGGGGGSSIILDIGDDGANESTGITEIATNADANTIITEPSADKVLIDMARDWPKADTSDDLTCTNCIGPTEITDIALGTDTSGGYAASATEGGNATNADALEGVDFGTLTDTKWCKYDLAGTEVDCNVEPVTDTDDQTCAEVSGCVTSAAPGNADYLVGTTNAGLSAEIVVGTAPGGELGGTWASPTVDATHSGSAHHSAATITADSGGAAAGQAFTLAGGTGIATSRASNTITIASTLAGLNIARTLYVTTDGNDANNCTISAPCATIQRCINRSTEEAQPTSESNPITCIVTSGLYDEGNIVGYNNDSASSKYLLPAGGIGIRGQGRATTIVKPITVTVTNCVVDLTGSQSMRFVDIGFQAHLTSKPVMCSRGGAVLTETDNVDLATILPKEVMLLEGGSNHTHEHRGLRTYGVAATGRHYSVDTGLTGTVGFCGVNSGISRGACINNADCGGRCDDASTSPGAYCTGNADCTGGGAVCNTGACGNGSGDYLMRHSLLQASGNNFISERGAVCQGGATEISGDVDTTASATVTGTSTLFLAETAVGEQLIVGSETRTIRKIANNTSMTVSRAFSDQPNDTTPQRSDNGWPCTTNADCDTGGTCTAMTGGSQNQRLQHSLILTGGPGGECEDATTGAWDVPPVACATNADCTGKVCKNSAMRIKGSGNAWLLDHDVFQDISTAAFPAYTVEAHDSSTVSVGLTAFDRARLREVSSGNVDAAQDGFLNGVYLEPQASAPTSLAEGLCWWLDSENQQQCYDGTTTRELVAVDETTCLANEPVVYDGSGNASCTSIPLGTGSPSISGILPEANGGTDQSVYVTGDILYASATDTLTRLPKGTSGQFLKIGATVPAWANVGAATDLTGLLPLANGGFAANMTTPVDCGTGDNAYITENGGSTCLSMTNNQVVARISNAMVSTAVTTAMLASPSGGLTNVITGTEGTVNTFPKWDADGDIVESNIPNFAFITGGTTTNLYSLGTAANAVCIIDLTAEPFSGSAYGALVGGTTPACATAPGSTSFIDSIPIDIAGTYSIDGGCGVKVDGTAGAVAARANCILQVCPNGGTCVAVNQADCIGTQGILEANSPAYTIPFSCTKTLAATDNVRLVYTQTADVDTSQNNATGQGSAYLKMELLQ